MEPMMKRASLILNLSSSAIFKILLAWQFFFDILNHFFLLIFNNILSIHSFFISLQMLSYNFSSNMKHCCDDSNFPAHLHPVTTCLRLRAAERWSWAAHAGVLTEGAEVTTGRTGQYSNFSWSDSKSTKILDTHIHWISIIVCKLWPKFGWKLVKYKQFWINLG